MELQSHSSNSSFNIFTKSQPKIIRKEDENSPEDKPKASARVNEFENLIEDLDKKMEYLNKNQTKVSKGKVKLEVLSEEMENEI